MAIRVPVVATTVVVPATVVVAATMAMGVVVETPVDLVVVEVRIVLLF
jgi:hypothetical protein